MVAPVAPAGRVGTYGGRAIHLSEREGHGPVVVLLGGCGVPSYQWDDVVNRLDPQASLAVDRPGLLGTPWPGVLPSLADEVATLDDLIRELDGPVVLVGHSMGGPHAEAYARLHPERVAGLVLLDSSVDWNARPPRRTDAWLAAARFSKAVTALPPLAMLGSLADRVLTSFQSDRPVSHPVRQRARTTFRDGDTIAAVVAEQAAYEGQMWDLAQLRGRTEAPRVPCRVLAATHGAGAKWLPCQRRLAESLGGTVVELPHSHHLIMLDQPEAVSSAVQAVTAQARPA